MTAQNESKNCKVKDCKRGYRAKGYCRIHYKKWRRGELGQSRYKTCGNEGCFKPMAKLGMCVPHYEAWSKSRSSTVEVPAQAATQAPAEGAPAS